MIITGKILRANGTARTNTAVRFLPVSAPVIDSTGLLTAPTIVTTTDTNGLLPANFTLLEGTYEVQIGHNKRDVTQIIVAEGNASVEFTRLIQVSDASTRTYYPQFYMPAAGVNYELNTAQSAKLFTLRNLSTGRYNPFWCQNIPSFPQLFLDVSLVAVFPLGNLPGQGDNYRVWQGRFQLENTTSLRWNTIYLTGAEGAEQLLALEEIRDAADDKAFLPYVGFNYRLHNNCFQLFNQTTRFFQTLYTTGADGVQQLVILPHE